MWVWLQGKKTYLATGGAGIVLALYLAGLIEERTADILLLALGFGGLAALRAGVNKSAAPTSVEKTKES